MKRQSTSQQRNEKKKEQKTKDKSKYSGGLRCLQSIGGRGDWLLPVVPLPRLPSAFFCLSCQKRLPIQMTQSRHRCPLFPPNSGHRAHATHTGYTLLQQQHTVLPILLSGRKKKGIGWGEGGLLLVKHCLPQEERY